MPGLVGSWERSPSETDGFPLSTVALTRPVDLPVRLQQDYYRINEGCKDLWRILHNSKVWLSELPTYYTSVKFSAVIFAMGIFSLFISEM